MVTSFSVPSCVPCSIPYHAVEKPMIAVTLVTRADVWVCIKACRQAI